MVDLPSSEATPEAVIAPKSAAASKKPARAVRQVPHAHAYIQATFNNTIVTITDQNGNTLAWASAGHCGFKGPKKATPFAASMIVKTLAEKLIPFGVKDLNVYVKGIGQGRDSSVRAFNTHGLNVLSLLDMTPLPHNGCRARKPRRI